MGNIFWEFIDDQGGFVANNPHKISRLYFPLANEGGLLSCITPTLHGDIKIDQHSFITHPVSTEDLHNSRYNRNFWVYVPDIGAWSCASGEVDNTIISAGPLWHKLLRINKRIGLKVEFTNFVPATNELLEIMLVELTNISKKNLRLIATSAIPLYGRSADRLRDHRHVSSLLNRIELNKYGVILTPTMSFDEKLHSINTKSYFVLGCDGNSNSPIGSFPTILEFSGEGGDLDKPDSVLKNLPPKRNPEINRQGKEAIGALRFKSITLKPNSSTNYIILIGMSQNEKPNNILKKFNSLGKINSALSLTKKFWIEKINKIQFQTYNKDFDRWLKWVSIQPALRKIYGCSFLPDFDYGRGGRGWRDMWQDCLTLLLINPQDTRNILINNFGAVREDGSNATIIGKNPGEFIADRNNISRVWMDHGVWPFITLNLYINQTGDTNILFENAPYFEGSKIDTVLNHILLQHERPFSKLGGHGNFLLEGGDWNDGLDMATEQGESVAFTSAYIGNLLDIADLLEKINDQSLSFFLLSPTGHPEARRAEGSLKETINKLRQKANNIRDQIRKTEWLTTGSGYSFFNGYYDNLGRKVEGEYKNGIHMTLTGQVFSIMSGVAEDYHIREIYRSAKRYLWDKKLRGFRLNTDFGGIYPELGRAFSFAYGEKENGAFFSHMNVMFAYALYKRGFVKEGYEVLNSIYKMCMHTTLSKIYPGLPEYFNSDGRGMYHYLTGSASWFMLTLLTQVFGIRGEIGNLLISPKLVKEQFLKSDFLSVTTNFAGEKIRVRYFNPDKLDYGEYKINKLTINNKLVEKLPVDRRLFLNLASSTLNLIDIELTKI